MKKIIPILIAVISFSSACKKEKVNTNGNSPQSEAGFFYGENGTSTLTKADEVVANSTYKTIIAKKDNKTVVEFVLTDLKAGDYDLSKKYACTYVKNGGHWEASAGTLTITTNDGNKISGTFKATAGAGVTGVNTVEGKFSEVEIKN